jgi:hypothetical protein
MNRTQLIWKNFVLLVRRAPKDRRAMRALIGIFLVVIGLSAYAAVVLLNPGSYILGLPALLVLWLIRRLYMRADEGLIKLSGLEKRNEGNDLARHREELATVALVLAAMIDRAGSEAFLKTKEMPEGVEVITRQRLVAMLRSAEIWDVMPSTDREKMMLPDGGWNWQQITDALRQVEDLRVLRWVLRVDTYLLPIEQAYKLHLNVATELVSSPTKVQGDGCLEAWEMEEARDYANSYFGRCWAEEQKRGLVAPPGEQTTEDELKQAQSEFEQIVRYATELGAQQSGDFLLGSDIVGDSSDEHLKNATMIAWRRATCLGRVMTYLRGPADRIEQLVEAETAQGGLL